MKFLFITLLGIGLFLSPGSQQVWEALSGRRTFTHAEQSLILAADTLTPMRVLLITDRADSLVLRRKSRPIAADPTDPVLQHMVRRLYRTVRDSMTLGVGIAAPQVGILRKIIWVQRFDKEHFPFEVYLNPVIKWYSPETQPCPEGCLSIPDRRETLNIRAARIAIEYDTMTGTHLRDTVSGFTAVIFQHEIDHLSGILYIDHLQAEIRSARRQP
ncbi:MAG: peptide deformylase [Bacteroidia bacterium]|nr:peptide deformylase [Bacteroidia bacterium]